LTKKGLVSVLVIRQAETPSAMAVPAVSARAATPERAMVLIFM